MDRSYNFSREQFIDIPSRDNVTFDYTLAFCGRERIAPMTDTKAIDFVSCKLSVPVSYLFLVFSQMFFSTQSDISVIFEATYRDVKVMGPWRGPAGVLQGSCRPIGSSLISSLPIWNQVLFSLTEFYGNGNTP